MAKKTYAQLKAELDAILVDIQQGELDVDEALNKYEQGMKLVKELEQYLKSAENKIKKLRVE